MDQTPKDGAIADSQASSNNARERLMDELTHTISAAEKWLEDAAGNVTSGISSETRARFDDTLRTAKSDLLKLEESLIAHGREAADQVDLYVQDNPWKAVTIGAVVGLLAGLLITRQSS
jgi:ElaB/YqjD/DUF883 family membrane-anchored ribosome-binding protein